LLAVGSIVLMTSSITLKKIVSTGAALMLALSGSLVATPAQAAVSLVTAPMVTPAGNAVAIDGYVSQTSYATFSGVPNNYAGNGPTVTKWLICDSAPNPTYAVDGTDVPVGNNCQDVYTVNGLFTGTGLSLSMITALGSSSSTVSPSSLVGKYVVRFEMSKNMTDQTIYAWAMSAPKQLLAAPTMSGASGNVNGVVGTALAMPAYTTTGFGSSVTFSYTVGNALPLPSGITFDATTGQLTGIPTSAASNLSVTVTATGSNGLTKNSVFNLTITSGQSNNQNQNQNQNQSAPTQLVAPTITVVGNSAVVTAGTYSNGSVMGNWEYCLTAKAAVTVASMNMMVSDCGPLFLTSSGGSNYSNVARTLTLDLSTTYFARPLGTFGNTLLAVDLSGKFVRYQEFVNSSQFMTATVPAAGGSVTSTDSTDVTDVTEDQRPLPVWASNIVSSIPTLTKALVSTGGSVALTGGDYADLKSVTIGGKAVAFKIETTGNVNIPVPAGEAGKTADIVIVFAGGTMTVQDGIKYVAQVDVAKVAERPIAIAAGAKKITEAIADQIRQAAFANPKNTHIQCVAYAANSSAKAQAAAKLTAVQACGIAAKANPALKISEVSVIVNKAKARQSAVGIKVYKQN
jgi:hypothetical protein